MLKASLDIGSNSCFFCIAEVDNKEIKRVLFEDFVITGLGEGIKSQNILLPGNLKILYDFLQIVVLKCRDFNFDPSTINAVATEASRRASNTAEMIRFVKENFKIDINVISAQEEARLSSLGVCLGHPSENQINIIDLGGASTELICFDSINLKILSTVSIPLGSVLATEILKSAGQSELERIVSESVVGYQNNSKFYFGVAGTITTLAAMLNCSKAFDVEKVHNVKIKCQEIKKITEHCHSLSVSQIENDFPVVGKRSKTIIGGALLLVAIMEKMKLNEVTVSNFGLRHGLLLN